MHGGGSSGSGPKKKARIEIIPLIDVIMFLLATFVLFTLSMQQTKGQAVKLFEAKTGEDRENPKESVTISVNNNGELFWNKDAIVWDNFIIQIVRYKTDCENKGDEPVVFINFDEEASFGSAMSVLDEIRKAQIQKVKIETRFTSKTVTKG
jgi:biopolymer transport protein ExbD